jgi:hypothetical protein
VAKSTRWLLLAPLGLLLAGCGVSFSNPPEGTEFFKSLTVSGEMTAGAQLTAAVTFEQKNPVDTTVKCEVRRAKELVKEIGSAKAPLHPLGGPEATPFPGNFAFDFSLDEPGAYKLECFTPADEDNFIIKNFTLAPRHDAAAETPRAG